jgi:hypothetical protein
LKWHWNSRRRPWTLWYKFCCIHSFKITCKL